MPLALKSAEAAGYDERGYHFPIRAFSEDEAGGLYLRLVESERMLGGPFKGRHNQKAHLLFPWLYDIVTDSRILDAVEPVLGPDLFCWSSGFFNKWPGDGNFVSWHQDATYWGLSSPDVLTAWVAFTPSTRASGCMRVMPGTHMTQLPHADTFSDKNMLSRGQEIAAEVDEAKAVDIELKPGEMSLHHVLLVHGSEVNRTEVPRVGLAIRYIPTRLRQLGIDRTSATPARGKDVYGNFDHELRPEGDLHPAAVERHRQITERQLGVLYAGAAKPGKRAAADMSVPPVVGGM
ncbi:MAG: phytanoyl-CoA dioxygenase [Alphaproteobacteria bacterium]|nr:phytanoyl-CoA dioxygenase [Alphaproteobacteria bacterium]